MKSKHFCKCGTELKTRSEIHVGLCGSCELE